MFRKVSLFVVLIVMILGAGCSRYRVTLNNNPIYNPPPLLKVVNIADTRLQTCIQQQVQDNKISKANQLHQLNCSSAGITRLDGIQQFSRIRRLSLRDNKLKDIEPLFSLPNIEGIDLRENPQVDCKQIARLAQIVNSDISQFPKQCLSQIP